MICYQKVSSLKHVSHVYSDFPIALYLCSNVELNKIPTLKLFEFVYAISPDGGLNPEPFQRCALHSQLIILRQVLAKLLYSSA